MNTFQKNLKIKDKSQHLKHWQWGQTLPERSIWLSRNIVTPFSHKIVEGTLTVGNCCTEKAKFLHFGNGFFDLLFIAFATIIIQNGLPQRILPLCLTVKLSALVQNSVHLQMAARKLTHPPALSMPFQDIFVRLNGLFTLFPHSPPSLIHKRTWHSDPDKMVILRQ